MNTNDAAFEVAELFESINGEGPLAGQLAVFVRLKGCNLQCSYCDTSWANEPGASFTIMSASRIARRVQDTGIANVTITGGEPLLAPHIDRLFEVLWRQGSHVEVETNGSISIAPFSDAPWRPAFTMDYKLPGSGMESSMNTDNFHHLREPDAVKFVCSHINDMERAMEIIEKYQLTGRCRLLFSPVYRSIDPQDMVEFMKSHRLNQIQLQLQLHKYIWPPMTRGV